MVTYEELLNADVKDLPSKTLIDAWYDGTKYMCDFSREVMLPLLRQLLKPSEREIAVKDVYFRICLYLRSIIALNTLDHVQSVASAARSIFELWIDLELLARDSTGESARRYHCFAELERFRQAEQIVRFADANPEALKMDVSAQRRFCGDAERKFRLEAEWGTTKAGRIRPVPHWTGLDLRARAGSIGHEASYIEAQPILSWYVHSGSAGTAGMTRVGLEMVYGLSHIFTQRFFLDATRTCATVTKISEVPDFARWIREMLYKSGHIIVDEQIKQLQEKQK